MTSNFFDSRSELSRMDVGNVEGYIISKGSPQDSNSGTVVPTSYLQMGPWIGVLIHQTLLSLTTNECLIIDTITGVVASPTSIENVV